MEFVAAVTLAFLSAQITLCMCFFLFVLKQKMDEMPRPELFDFHGVSMTHYFTDNWENIQNFQARPDDILIATYPKAGQFTRTALFRFRSHFLNLLG